MPSASQLAQAHWNETPLFLTPEQRYAEYPWLPEVAEFAKHRGDRVLELGCGTGCDLLQFATNGAIATGVDITDSHLDLARKRIGNKAVIVRADIRNLPFPDQSFDYIYSHGVLHHSNEPEKVAAEIIRVLCPGGRFNIQVYAKWSESALIYRLKHGKDWARHVENSTTPVHLELYTARRMRKLFPGIALEFSKYQSYQFPLLSSFTGWYLVCKGKR